MAIIFHTSSNPDYHLRTPLYALYYVSLTCSFVDIWQPLIFSMYRNYFSSPPKRRGTTNFISTIYLSCLTSRLELLLLLILWFDASEELCLLFSVFLYRCVSFSVSFFVGVNPVIMFPSGSTSIKPYYSLFSASFKPFGMFLTNLLIVMSLNEVYFFSNIYSSNSFCLRGMEFLNCWAKFSLIDLPLWRIGPPFLKHYICYRIKQAASILFYRVPFIDIMHSLASLSDCLSDIILIWVPPDLSMISLIMYPSKYFHEYFAQWVWWRNWRG